MIVWVTTLCKLSLSYVPLRSQEILSSIVLIVFTVMPITHQLTIYYRYEDKLELNQQQQQQQQYQIGTNSINKELKKQLSYWEVFSYISIYAVIASIHARIVARPVLLMVLQRTPSLLRQYLLAVACWLLFTSGMLALFVKPVKSFAR